SASRQSMLDKRRFEAVEKVWTAANDLAPYKNLSGMMAVLKIKALAKEANDPRMQQFFKFLDSMVPNHKSYKDVARDEQPFLPELAWGYYAAYRMVVFSSFITLQVLKLGMENPEEAMTKSELQKVLTVALPHHKKYIDEQEPHRYHYLLDELERSL